MKALTLIRPWAWAIVASTKRIENRTWVPYKAMLGQRIAIHAGQKLDAWDYQVIAEIHGSDPDASCEDQGIVGTALLTGVVTESDDPWFNGPYGWTLDDVVRLAEPIPCKGAQGFWRLPADIAARIKP